MLKVLLLLACFITIILCPTAPAQIAKPLDPQMEALPQLVDTQRGSSDAADEGLKGKIRLVVQERSDILAGGIRPRQMSNVMLFDEKGNFVQRDYYDYRGNPYEVTIYGYIDGMRVSKSRYIAHEYDPPAAAPSRGTSQDSSKRDSRYGLGYEYTYVKGQLAEERLISNSGKKLIRYVYVRSPDEIEEFVFTADNVLNQRFLRRLDTKGNVVEEIWFGLSNRDIYGDSLYKYSYEYDKRGNWIKKQATREFVENGVPTSRPEYIQYRTLEYF